MPEGWVPSARAGPAMNSCSKAGMTSTAIWPTPAPTGSVGTSRQPSNSRPSSARMPSTIAFGLAPAVLLGWQEATPTA